MSGKNFLDADGTLLEQNLKFVKNEFEDELKHYFGQSNESANAVAPPRDYKVVMPRPGFCIKSFKINTNEKYFINVCQTEEIPAPEDIREEQLTEILQSDAPSSFRIPMSISEPRITKDKSNNPVDVCDIAINPKFFAKCEKSLLFKDFFLALIAEALSDKYNVQIKIEKAIILNNRKSIGTLVSHRVRNNDVKTVLTSYKHPTASDKEQLSKLDRTKTSKTTPLVQEVNEKEVKIIRKKAEELLKRSAGKMGKQNAQPEAGPMQPEYQLRAKFNGEEVEEIQAEFFLPKCISSREINLDIGGDRIVLESTKHGYLFNKFVDMYELNQERVSATFDKSTKMFSSTFLLDIWTTVVLINGGNNAQLVPRQISNGTR